MMVLICFLLPPVFLMYMREKILKEKTKCNFHGKAMDFLREYLLSVCFLNLAVIVVVYFGFHHENNLDQLLLEYTSFDLHYLLLALAMGILEPVTENLLRFHMKVEIHKGGIRVNKNWILYGYAFLLFLLNFIRIFDNAFWGDEGFSIRLAKMSVRDMVAATAEDVHPPLYYLLVQALYHMFGNNGIAYHLSALLPYAAIIVIGCTVVRKIFGFLPAAVLITMASLMKSAVVYNVEVRMYALSSLLILIAYVAFYKIIEENRLSGWIIFCIFSIGAAYTHYYALVSVAFLYAMLIPLAIFRKKYHRGMLFSYLAAILGYSPWLMTLVRSFQRTESSWFLEGIPTIRDCALFLLDYKWMIIYAVCCLFLFLAYQTGFLKVRISDKGKFPDRLDIRIHTPEKIQVSVKMYWILSGVISVCGTVAVGLLLSHLIRPFFMVRYLFPVSAMVFLMIGVCTSNMNLRKIWGGGVILAILCVNVPAWAETYRWDYNINRETENFLDAVQPSMETEIVTNGMHLNWTLLEYYYPDNAHKYAETLMHLDSDYEDLCIIWNKTLDEETEQSISEQNYTLSQRYEGYFSEGKYYYVYDLHQKDKSKN